MYREAAKTAVVIASEEQANGSYRIAHQLLFGMYQELLEEGIKVSFDVQNNLMLLHSYLIIKTCRQQEESLRPPQDRYSRAPGIMDGGRKAAAATACPRQ
ncbi:unnamed protein product [Gongylonema pulchrum]|uniref:14_3_3 domain-containing protein n=1 Tax=Gongylonema pulchrum TaxID=637853 RepID=A0A183EZ26_9BILA|nr:unnamed protein product [Gongylonema pulchrum]